MADVLDQLYSEEKIGELAFRGCDSEIHDGRCTIGAVCEEIEYGLRFSMDLHSLPHVTKLYSNQYEDQLWVTVNGSEMQFEELCEDYKSTEDAVITQLVHLMYEHNDDTYVITHIDHEYLFYSHEDYEKRKADPHVKGRKQKRIKTFKADKSRIRFNYPCNVINVKGANEAIQVPFIMFILNAYFKHKDLLDEYFAGIE